MVVDVAVVVEKAVAEDGLSLQDVGEVKAEAEAVAGDPQVRKPKPKITMQKTTTIMMMKTMNTKATKMKKKKKSRK